MRFGGHETFAIREGWLHKGLKLLQEDPGCFNNEFIGDWLGVGPNMAKSIKHWLVATGLAEHVEERAYRKSPGLRLSDLGKEIFEHDPFFTAIGTWWVLHINLVNNANFATTWGWFFNNINLGRFEKSVCIDGLRRYLQLTNIKIPSNNTLERDVSCFLSSYSEKIPPDQLDPEDAQDCPFIELGLMTHYRNSGYYHLNFAPKEIPPYVFSYAVATINGLSQGKGMVDIPLSTIARQQGGPGRCFVLTSESLFETMQKMESYELKDPIEIVGHAGERAIRIKKRDPLVWLKMYYSAGEKGDRCAA